MEEIQSSDEVLAATDRMDALEQQVEELKVQTRHSALLRENDNQLRDIYDILITLEKNVLKMTKTIELLRRTTAGPST